MEGDTIRKQEQERRIQLAKEREIASRKTIYNFSGISDC
jgi:hypothetical protein